MNEKTPSHKQASQPQQTPLQAKARVSPRSASRPSRTGRTTFFPTGIALSFDGLGVPAEARSPFRKREVGNPDAGLGDA